MDKIIATILVRDSAGNYRERAKLQYGTDPKTGQKGLMGRWPDGSLTLIEECKRANIRDVINSWYSETRVPQRMRVWDLQWRP